MKNLNPPNRKSIALFSLRFNFLFVCIVTFSFISIFALNAQEYSRGVGVYPGDVREDFLPVIGIDTTNYRNLALRRPAYHSSSYNYNLTAQLVTDGIKDLKLPGWDHTFYEPSMPGYLALYHNALWASLSSGLSMTPFWWSHSRFVNDNVVTQQLTSIKRFTSGIPFNKLDQIVPVKATLSNGDAFAMKSEQLTFGWVVNPETDVSGALVSVSSLYDGDYILQLYHTWRGRFFHEEKIACKNGTIEFSIPVLKIEDYHARYVGQDIAFILTPVE